MVAAGMSAAAAAVPSCGRRGAEAANKAGSAHDATSAVTTVERVYSASRRRTLDLVITRPAGHDRADGAVLPVCLFLHGLHGTARSSAPGNLAGELGTGIKAGTLPPFAIVALDGGDSYWHHNRPGDDPMAMLLEEVPVWLRERGLGANGVPFACAGVSMGGFGALLYTRRRNERRDPVAVTAVMAPGLITTWAEMAKRDAFRDRADWVAHDPLKHLDALGTGPVGIWCGLDDRFIEGARRFIAAARPKRAYLAAGGHDDTFFRDCIPDLLRFVGGYAPTRSAASD